MRKRLFFTTALIFAGLLAGCGPAYQKSTTPNIKDVTLDPTGLSTIQSGIDTSSTAQMYKITSDVTLQQGSLHTNFSLYGSINAPNIASLSLHENNFNANFYQQGMSAYETENNQWQQTNAVEDLNIFNSYRRMFNSLQDTPLRVYRFNQQQFVMNEYCNAYTVSIPGKDAAKYSMWDNGQKLPDLGTVVYTFYIGKTDHRLIEVQTTSVGSVENAGPITETTNTLFTDFNNELAQVTVPPNLIGALSSSSS